VFLSPPGVVRATVYIGSGVHGVYALDAGGSSNVDARVTGIKYK
jgi:hypothetical protein